MTATRVIVGILLILAGIFLGLYVGLYLLFIGGIISIIDGAKADPTNSSMIAWGVVRVLCASTVGAALFWLFAAVGGFVFFSEPSPKPGNGSGNRQVEHDWDRIKRDAGY